MILSQYHIFELDTINIYSVGPLGSISIFALQRIMTDDQMITCQSPYQLIITNYITLYFLNTCILGSGSTPPPPPPADTCYEDA